MRFRKVPVSLQKTIRGYYEYLWDSGQTSHNANLFADLPSKLRLQLNVALKKRLIEKVPLFKTCSPAGVIALVQNLQPHIILPNDLIIRQGEQVRAPRRVTRLKLQSLEHCVTQWSVTSAAAPDRVLSILY
jgi:hypothetical protein